MKSATKAKILNFLGLFNILRTISYQKELSNADVINFYKGFVKKDCLCFDIGANIGRVTDILLRLGARVIALEPHPGCVRYLKLKYRFNSRVTVVPLAVDAIKGKKDLFLCEVNSLSTLNPDWIKACKESRRYEEFHWNKHVEVQTETLDSLIRTYGQPDYLKIDVEGNEFHVLRGLSQRVSLISLEISPEMTGSTLKCIDHLSFLGYLHFNFSSGESAIRFDLPQWIPASQAADLIRSRPRFGYLWASGDFDPKKKDKE